MGESDTTMLKYICYNWMPTIADHILDVPQDFYTAAGTKALHTSENFNPIEVKDNDLIFVKTDFIVNGLFQKDYMDKIYRRFNLITGVSSYNLGRDGGEIYRKVLDHPNLNKWICTNPPDIEHKKIIPIPIGFQEPSRAGGNQEFLSGIHNNCSKFEEKKDLVFLPYHNVSTNPHRQQMVEYLSSLPFVVAQKEKQSLEEYYNSMSQYKFVIGLEGSGPDIHRNYESMLVNSIPINIKNVIQKVFNFHDADAIFLNNWKELNENLINKLLKIPYNLAKNKRFLEIETHISRIKREIR